MASFLGSEYSAKMSMIGPHIRGKMEEKLTIAAIKYPIFMIKVWAHTETSLRNKAWKEMVEMVAEPDMTVCVAVDQLFTPRVQLFFLPAL